MQASNFPGRAALPPGSKVRYQLKTPYRNGDCHAPRQALNAIFDGHRLAREFDSPHPQYPLPWIRERQVWQAETVALPPRAAIGRTDPLPEEVKRRGV